MCSVVRCSPCLLFPFFCVLFCLISSYYFCFFFFSSRRRHTRCLSNWSSDVCSSDLVGSTASGPSSYWEDVGHKIGVGTRDVAEGLTGLPGQLLDLATWPGRAIQRAVGIPTARSEEHTSELQSLRHLVCRLLLEKKNN